MFENKKKMKHLTFLFFISLCCILASCGPGKENSNNTDKNDSIPSDLAALNKKIADNPKDAASFNKRAELYIKKSDVENALRDINQALQIDPKNSAYLRTLSDIYFSMGKVEKCRETLLKAMEINPADNEAILKLSELLFYLKEYQKVLDYTSKALKNDEGIAKAYFIKGMTFKEIGDTAKAVKSFQIAVEKNQDYYDAYMQLGLLFSIAGNPLAVDYFNNALNINPKSTEAYYGLAMFYQENEQEKKAIDIYKNIIKLDPKDKRPYYNIGYINLVYLKKYDDAESYFSEAIKNDPGYAEAYYNRGFSYELAGNKKNAISDYKKALELKTNYEKAIKALNRIEGRK
jgi:tetratricopeptide (TPR) repeat protein